MCQWYRRGCVHCVGHLCVLGTQDPVTCFNRKISPTRFIRQECFELSYEISFNQVVGYLAGVCSGIKLHANHCNQSLLVRWHITTMVNILFETSNSVFFQIEKAFLEKNCLKIGYYIHQLIYIILIYQLIY